MYLRREKDLSASKSTSKKKRNRATSFEDFSPIPTRNNKKLSHGSLQGKTMKFLDIFKRVCRIPFIFLFYSSVKEFYSTIRQRSCLFRVDLFKRQKKLRSLLRCNLIVNITIIYIANSELTELLFSRFLLFSWQFFFILEMVGQLH